MLGINPQTRRASQWAAVAAATLIAQQVAGKAVRDTLFLTSFDVTMLPRMVLVASALSFVSVLLTSYLLSRYGPSRLVPWAFAGGAALLAGEWLLARVQPASAAILFYLHMCVYGASMISAFWSLVTERFDPYAARRLMGSIAGGATVGGVFGGLTALAVAGRVQPVTLLLLLAGLSLLGLVAVLQVERGAAGRGGSEPPEPTEPENRSHEKATAMPYMRNLALLVGLAACASVIVDYAVKDMAVQRYAEGDALLRFFAILYTGIALASLLLQTTAARRSLHHLGLAATVSLRPALVMLGAAVCGIWPLFINVLTLRVLDSTLQNSLFRSAYELFYTPLPLAWKRRGKILVDVGSDRLGEAVGSGLVMLALALVPSGEVARLAVPAGVAALGALLLAPRLHRGYAKALARRMDTEASGVNVAQTIDSLTLHTLSDTSVGVDRMALLEAIEKARAALPQQQAPEITDPMDSAIGHLESGRTSQAIRVLQDAEPLDPSLLSHVIPLLGRDELYRPALRALRRVADRCAEQLLEALTDARLDPVARRRLPQVLRTVTTPQVARGLTTALDDPEFEVRRHAAHSLAFQRSQNKTEAPPREAMLEHVRRELRELPTTEQSETAQRRRLRHVFTLIGLAYQPASLDLAWRALKGHEEAARGTGLEYLDVVLPEDLRSALRPHLGTTLASRPAVQREADELLAELKASRKKK